MIVTVSIREENGQSSSSVSASATSSGTFRDLVATIADAGDDAIDAARQKGGLA